MLFIYFFLYIFLILYLFGYIFIYLLCIFAYYFTYVYFLPSFVYFVDCFHASPLSHFPPFLGSSHSVLHLRDPFIILYLSILLYIFYLWWCHWTAKAKILKRFFKFVTTFSKALGSNSFYLFHILRLNQWSLHYRCSSRGVAIAIWLQP